MNKIIWNESLNTGINQIDKQHLFLVDRINELVELNSYKEDSSNLYPIVLLLISYAQFHFKYEQDYLQKLNYSEIKNYAKKYQNLIKEIDEFNENYINGLIDINEEFISHLNDLLKNHILGEDMAFLKEFVQKGEKNGD